MNMATPSRGWPYIKALAKCVSGFADAGIPGAGRVLESLTDLQDDLADDHHGLGMPLQAIGLGAEAIGMALQMHGVGPDGERVPLQEFRLPADALGMLPQEFRRARHGNLVTATPLARSFPRSAFARAQRPTIPVGLSRR